MMTTQPNSEKQLLGYGICVSENGKCLIEYENHRAIFADLNIGEIPIVTYNIDSAKNLLEILSKNSPLKLSLCEYYKNAEGKFFIQEK